MRHAADKSQSIDCVIYSVILNSVESDYITIFRKALDQCSCRRDYGLVLSVAVYNVEDTVLIEVLRSAKA